MLEIQSEHEVESREIESGDSDDYTGKSLHHVAHYGQERPGPGPDRRVIDIVTDDGSVYRFAQLTPQDPLSFEPGNGADNRVQRTGRLPHIVEQVIAFEAAEANTGWQY